MKLIPHLYLFCMVVLSVGLPPVKLTAAERGSGGGAAGVTAPASELSTPAEDHGGNIEPLSNEELLQYLADDPDPKIATAITRIIKQIHDQVGQVRRAVPNESSVEDYLVQLGDQKEAYRHYFERFTADFDAFELSLLVSFFSCIKLALLSSGKADPRVPDAPEAPSILSSIFGGIFAGGDSDEEDAREITEELRQEGLDGRFYRTAFSVFSDLVLRELLRNPLLKAHMPRRASSEGDLEAGFGTGASTPRPPNGEHYQVVVLPRRRLKAPAKPGGQSHHLALPPIAAAAGGGAAVMAAVDEAVKKNPEWVKQVWAAGSECLGGVSDAACKTEEGRAWSRYCGEKTAQVLPLILFLYGTFVGGGTYGGTTGCGESPDQAASNAANPS